ncbi:MAG: nucleotide exchange factor GrpE [Acidimicrobiia bacterium]|nr:nucleotide exchange factor GrpE [Acidimicrobiia bacterium]
MPGSHDVDPPEPPGPGGHDRGDDHDHDDLVDLGPAGDEAAEVLAEAEEVLHEAAEHLGAGGAADAGPGTFVDGTEEPSELRAERDEYLEALRRVKAEFENSKKRWTRERDEMATRATAQLVERLLPVLDACDAAISQGSTEVEPVYKTLLETLSREGLAPMETEGQIFDPHLHEAVVAEPADDSSDGQTVVVDTLRTGYLWNGSVLRAAMVKVKG